MALITCPECGKDISDKATTCPNCGVPMTLQKANQTCPNCGSSNVFINREQSGTVGASTNKVVVVKKKSKGCLYWLIIGWWLEPIYWLCIGWWTKLFFGGISKGLNFHASKSINKTVAICQDCGHNWFIK